MAIELKTPAEIKPASRLRKVKIYPRRRRSDHHLKEVNKSYNKKKTHARKEIMISIAMYIRCSNTQDTRTQALSQ